MSRFAPIGQKSNFLPCPRLKANITLPFLDIACELIVINPYWFNFSSIWDKADLLKKETALADEKKPAAGALGRSIKFLGDDTGLSLYLREIGGSRNLNLGEEADLAMRIRQGDRRALNKLINANLKFVVSVCRNYQNQGLPMTDLINEGNLGLIRAAKRFDETKHFKFISYAVWWIRQAILQALAEQSRIVNIPLNRVSAIHRLGKSGIQLEQKLGRSLSNSELSYQLSVGEKEVQECIQLSAIPLSLDISLAGR